MFRQRFRVVEVLSLGPVATVAQVVERRVDRNPMKKGREPRVAAIGGEGAVEGDEDLLDQIVALGDRADQARDARAYGIRVPAEEVREGGAVTLAGRRDHRGVVAFRLAVRNHGRRWSEAPTHPHSVRPTSSTTPIYGATAGVE